MKRILAALALGFLGAATTSGRLGAQTPASPSVDQILEKYISAVGGRAAIEKITSVTARGTIQIAGVDLTGTIELFQKAPNKSLSLVNLTGMGQTREGFDGAIGWSEDPQNGLRVKTETDLADTRRSSTFPRELKLKSLYTTLTLKGREPVGPREAYVIEAVPDDGTPARLFFDVESGLIVRQIGSRQTSQGLIEVDSTYEDFRAVDGVKRAFTIRQSTASFTAVIQFTELKHNVPIDDTMFRKPGG